MSDPLASLRQTACTKLTDVFGGWAFKPLLRGVREADGRPPADVFQRSLDDRTLLSALFEDGEVVIELLDVSDGRPRALIERRAALPNALCWDASGDTLLLANRDAPERMTLEVITLSSGKTRTLAIANDVRYIALLSDGRYAVVSELDHGKAVTRVYNLERGTVLRTWPRMIADMTSGAVALSQVSNGVLRWCPLDGEELGTILDAPERVFRSRAPLALHPDEITVAGIDTRGNVFCVDEMGKLRWSAPWPLSMDDWSNASLKWANHGATLFAMSGHAFASMRGHDGELITSAGGCVAPSARSDAALFARPMGFLSDLRDPDAPLSAQDQGHRATVLSLAVSSDGALVASSGIDFQIIVRKAGGEALWSHADASGALAFANDKTLVTAAPSGEINLWDATTGESLRRTLFWPGFARITDLSVSRDGRLALVTGLDLERKGTEVLAVDLAAGFGLWRWSCQRVRRARLVEGSREVTASRAHGFVSQLSLENGKPLDEAQVFKDFVREDGDFFFLRSGREALCVGGDGWPLRLIDMRTGDVRWERADPGCDLPTVALSDDGRWVAMALKEPLDGIVQLRAIETGAIVDQIDLRPLFDRPSCLAFSGDGKVLVIGTGWGVVLRFDCSALG